MLKNYSLSINTFVHELDKNILTFEDNARDLALIGSLFYKTDKNTELTKVVIKKIFENYNNSLGGGIWFEPYAFSKERKRLCYYMFRNSNGVLILDGNFESDEYDYHNQGWYKQIKSKITKEKTTAWSLPYYENQGSRTMMITVGTGIYDGNKLIGMSTVDWKIDSIFKELSEMKPIENGFSFFAKRKAIKDSFSLLASEKDNYIIVSTDPYLDNETLTGKTLDNIPWYNANLIKKTYFSYHNKVYVPFVKHINNGMMLIICVPKSEMFKDIDRIILQMLIVLSLLAFLIPALLYFGLNKYIINPIDKLTDIAEKISEGEDVKIKISKPKEFAQLAATFDQMKNSIKLIAGEQEKINSELSIAKLIQESSLPNVFPPYPDNSDFDIFASMETAKEVGGDFYDFYFIDNDNFMFLIADVSGKGVPAALFMMTVKTHINNLALIGFSPKELIKVINKKICENNKQGFFVTMLICIVNVKTGKLTIINCGHNLPLIKHKNGEYNFIKLDANLPLGLFENFDFKIYETQFEEGDMLFTYTDGVTEAFNDKEELFGETRLLKALNNIKDKKNIKDVLSDIKTELKTYTNSVAQSDDITMLGFHYLNNQKNQNLLYYDDAKIENYTAFYNWLHNTIEPWNLSNELINKIDLCAEEIFINIASYAYPEKTGKVEISVEKIDDEIILKFVDTGFAYNPLTKPDPDITLPPEKRQIGGLGIFMVKQSAKNVHYERNVNKNVLTMTFNCN
ncbi:SpoIIE family protein phosphatase [bacterium]|nr:SpoIIE family protein phosphatase [bacterium]